MSSVTIQNVTKTFGNTTVLENFDAVFADGEFITLLGPSGCGKTTMLRIIAGFEKPTSGSVLFDDRVVSSDKVFIPPEKRDIGMVFQSYAVWPHMTVFDNVAYPLQIKKVDKAAIKQKVEHVLEVVHLAQYRDRIPSQLSGGQQQRVALARALVAEPALLLLDEPLSNLDAKLRESMRFEIKDIQKQYGITVVYVTHDQTEAMTTVDINTGAFVGHRNLDDTIFNTNIEATQAIARQLRLRNLGGIIIIDFIDMNNEDHRRRVLHSLEQALSKDRVKTSVNGFSALGLVEMTRKRTRESIEHVLCNECPTCHGRGTVKTVETVCYEIMREIVRVHHAYDSDRFLVYASPAVAEALKGEESHSLAEVEIFVGKQVKVQIEPLYNQEQFDVVMM